MSLNIEDYLVTPAFVVMPIEEGGLGLKGNEAWVFSLIYGFSRDGASWFKGSQSYIAEWCGSTTRGIRKNLDSLIEKGLIEKRESKANGRLVCDYRVSPSSSYGNKVPTSEEQSLHHILIDNISPSDIDSNESISSPPKGKKQKQEGFVKPQVEDVVAYCIEHEFICDPYQFYDHFEANGWLVSGRAKMKDWVAALRNWERNERKRDPRFKT